MIAFLRSQFAEDARVSRLSEGIWISGYRDQIFSFSKVKNLIISSGLIFSKTKRRQRLRSALFTVKLGFSVVAPMSVIVPFSTKGKRVSCCDLFRRWISSRKTSVALPYFWFSSACWMMVVRSSFLLLTPERGKKSACIWVAMISARVVFPQPGGHRKSKEGNFFCSRKTESGFPSQIRCDCPTKVSSVFGRRREDNGSMIYEE